ncbi:MAG: hypothetical protein ACI35P_10965 [Bacillus sp. (in: firmicutes)]
MITNYMNKIIFQEQMTKYSNDKRQEIKSLDESISSIEDKMEELEKIAFLNGYLTTLETHVSRTNELMNEYKKYVEQLTASLQQLTAPLTYENTFTIDNHRFYSSADNETYTFFTHAGYDAYYGMDTYILFSYYFKNNNYQFVHSAIGFTDKPLSLLQNPLTIIQNNILMMDHSFTIEEIQQTYTGCEELLVQLFKVDHLREIAHEANSHIAAFYGHSPMNVIQLLRNKKENNLIRIQLEQKKVTAISDELILLVKTECNYKRSELLSEDLLQQLQTIKDHLLQKLQMKQQDLDQLTEGISIEL